MSKKLNRAKCGLCGDVIVSRSVHDSQTCKCGNISVDGGDDYSHVSAKKPEHFLRYVNGKWVPGFTNEQEQNQPDKGGNTMKITNETYKIKIESPLIRPGITIETKVSKKYLVPVLEDFLDQIREFNDKQNKKVNPTPDK